MRHSRIRLMGAAAACCLSNVVFADETSRYGNEELTERFFVSIGAFLPSTETVVRVDATDGSLGSTFHTEKQLDISESDVSFDAELLWRISKKHRIELEYFDISHNGRRILDADLNFGDVVFADQLEVASSLSTSVIRLGYGYSIFNNAKYELGLHAGIHITDVELAIALTGDMTTIDERASASTEAPLPVVGVHGSYRFAERWVVYGRAQFFKFDINDFDGRMTQFAVGVEHDTFARVNLGLAYKSFEIDVETEKSDWAGELDFKYSGPEIYFRVGFGG